MATSATATPLTANEVNYLILRYLQENGYEHSAFSFGTESLITKYDIDGSQVPPGALISFLQRGLAYVDIESSIPGPPSSSMDGARSLMEIHRILTTPREQTPPEEGQSETRNPPRSEPGPSAQRHIEIPESDGLVLQGHNLEVFALAWNPKSNLLASGSGDETARIWAVPNVSPSRSLPGTPSLVLQHPQRRGVPGNKTGNDVTTVSWNNEGTQLVTASFDGGVRVWGEDGTQLHEFRVQTRPLFAVQWNPSCTHLASCGLDKTVAVYKPAENLTVQHYKMHLAPALDVAWRSDLEFASCSVDKIIYKYNIEQDVPVMTYRGHQDEVNCVSYDPSGTLLASASDDRTAKVWDSSPDAVLTLTEHTQEVYVVRWCPSSVRTLMLATGSFDRLVKLWDVKTGTRLHTLEKHTEAVYTVEFSPSGDFVSTGSFDRSLFIWSTRDGSLVRSYQCPGGIFETRWTPAGDRVAVACNNGNVVVVDPRSAGYLEQSA